VGPEVGVAVEEGAALSKAAATRSAASPPSCSADPAAEADAGTAAFSGSVAAEGVVSGSAGRVRSAWGGTVAVTGSSGSVRPNILRSKLRMPMGEAFRMSWVR
jgi:hypothetical protein